jgi:hypothetical protein
MGDAVSWIRANFAHPVTVEMAASVQMSASAFCLSWPIGGHPNACCAYLSLDAPHFCAIGVSSSTSREAVS